MKLRLRSWLLIAGGVALSVAGCLNGTFNANGAGSAGAASGSTGGASSVTSSSGGESSSHSSTSGSTSSSHSSTGSSSSTSGSSTSSSSGTTVTCTGAKSTDCNGVCVDLGHDPKNCGMCGHVCQSPTPNCAPGSSGSATNAMCVNDCPQGLTACDNGCFVSFNSDLNCGSCGASCPASNVCGADVDGGPGCEPFTVVPSCDACTAPGSTCCPTGLVHICVQGPSCPSN